MNKKSLIMCLSYPSKNGRPKRFINLLNEMKFEVDVLSYDDFFDKTKIEKLFTVSQPSKLPVVILFRRIRNSILSLFTKIFKTSKLISLALKVRFNLFEFSSLFRQRDYDIIIVQDLNLLPFANEIKKSSKIIFDAREFYPLQNEESFYFNFFEKPQREYLCKNFLPKCDKVLTVSPGLVKAYRESYDVFPELIRSTPPYFKIKPSKTSNSSIKMVHHGIANKNRNIDRMIKIVNLLDERFTLDFFLTGPKSNIDYLKKKSNFSKKINFMDPVPFDEIIPMLNKYDLGFYYLEPKGFNVTYNLPNKFFEFIQARLGLAIGPSPDMAKLVNKYDCGFISKDFSISSMVKTLLELDANKINLAKHNSSLAAEELCFEKESQKLKIMINELS
tara:strand:- start:43 stop:1209 length:1167 start_codon:yes stop_codon:yes gene_type:complete